MKFTVKISVLLIFIFALSSYSAFAQGSFGDLKGVVVDSTGAVVVGASVEVKNQATNETRTVTTNDQGGFLVSRLNVGSYTISVTSPGFATSAVKDVKVSVAFVTDQNITLSPSGSQATVTVTSGDVTTQVNTTDQQLSTLINNQKIIDLPLLSRDPSSLVLLAPGTVQTDSGLGGFSVNGSRERNNNFIVDGVDNNDTDVPGIPGGIATPNIDATEEFRVITGNFNAEYGRNTGAIVTTATKRGTNQFHGGTYLYYRSDKFAARNFFDTTGSPDPLDRKQFGVSIGGPVIKDKLFFFFNYEGDRQKLGSQQYRVVPTAAARTGIFTTSQFGTLDITPNGANNVSGSLFGTQNFAFSPTSLAILNSIFPLPNYPANGAIPAPLPGAFEYYNFGYTARNHSNSIATRIDYNINDKNNLSFSVNYGKGDFSFGAPTFPSSNDELRTPQKGAVYSLNYISNISSNLLNEFRIGTNRASSTFNGPGSGAVSNSINEAVAAAFSANGAPAVSFGSGNSGILNLFTPFTSIGNFSTQGRTTGTTTVGDSFTWIKGNHTIKFGGETRFVYSNGQSNFNRQESLDFNLVGDFGPGAAIVVDNNGNYLGVNSSGNISTEGRLVNDYLSFLSGLVVVQSQTQFFDQTGQRVDNDFRRFRTNEYNFFAQDTWRIRSNLTFNYGLRYEYNTVPYEKNGLLSNLVGQNPNGATPNGGFVFQTVGKNSDNPDISLWKPDKNNFGPRVGFAYSPGFENGMLGRLFGGPAKSSFRGGFGIFYDRVFTNLFSNTSGNPPFSISVQQLPLFNLADPSTYNLSFIDALPRLTNQTATNTAVDGQELLVVLFPYNNNNLQDKFASPNSTSFNFGFQRELANQFLFEIDYIGTRGHNLLRAIDGQQASVLRANALLNQNNPISTSLRDNYLNGVLNTAFGQGGATLNLSTGNSQYDAMQVRLTKTLTNKRFGLGQLQAFYTWSHSIDDAPDALVTGTSDRSYPRDSSGYSGGLYAERGDSSFDARHRFVANFVYELPFHSSNGFVDRVIGNWSISGIYQAQTGYPFSIFAGGVDRQGTGLSARATYATNGNGFASNQTADNARTYTGPDRSLFAASVPLDGQQGNVGRGAFRGPNFTKFDFSLIKRIPLTERMKFTVRADFFNIFNRVNLGTPVSDVNSSLFGISTFAGSPRIIQFAGRFDF